MIDLSLGAISLTGEWRLNSIQPGQEFQRPIASSGKEMVLQWWG